VAAGARILLGGSALPGPGNFFAPTVLDDVPDGSPAAAEEIFGPVAALFAAEDLDGAIRIANRSRYGLGASAWTRDPAEQDRLVAEIDAGSVFINAVVQSDPRLPFGGIKKSGFGRELSREGIREFVNVKTVWMD
jgi:succinate-semialdehyde dehydrogenase/glutarate-semialdehyde dehydrogenase